VLEGARSKSPEPETGVDQGKPRPEGDIKRGKEETTLEKGNQDDASAQRQDKGGKWGKGGQ